MCTESFPGVESGRGVTLNRHSLLVPRSRKRVELYLYSPYGPSWPMTDWNVPIICPSFFVHAKAQEGTLVNLNGCIAHIQEYIWKGLVARFRIYFIRFHGARLEFHQTEGIIHETRWESVTWIFTAAHEKRKRRWTFHSILKIKRAMNIFVPIVIAQFSSSSSCAFESSSFNHNVNFVCFRLGSQTPGNCSEKKHTTFRTRRKFEIKNKANCQ
jgi:hypothetical protein